MVGYDVRLTGSELHAVKQKLGQPGASARAAATMVAVAPTLEARSHVSLSVRTTDIVPSLVSRGNNLSRLYASILEARTGRGARIG